MALSTTTTMTVEEAINSRHSVRQYKKGTPIPENVLNEILELAGKAPSSWNLQHWRFLVVQEQANKDRLLPLAYNQQQVSDASAVIIVLGDLQANLSAPIVYAQAPENIRDMMTGQVNGAYQMPQVARDEAIRNASLAAMQLMLAARGKGYDTVAMGGFDKDAVVKELNIPDRYIPVMMLALGEAASPGRATGRFGLEQIVIKESF